MIKRMKVHVLPYSYRMAYQAQPKAGLNKYGRHIIGTFVVLGDRCYCLKWAWARRRAGDAQ